MQQSGRHDSGSGSKWVNIKIVRQVQDNLATDKGRCKMISSGERRVSKYN